MGARVLLVRERESPVPKNIADYDFNNEDDVVGFIDDPFNGIDPYPGSFAEIKRLKEHLGDPMFYVERREVKL